MEENKNFEEENKEENKTQTENYNYKSNIGGIFEPVKREFKNQYKGYTPLQVVGSILLIIVIISPAAAIFFLQDQMVPVIICASIFAVELLLLFIIGVFVPKIRISRVGKNPNAVEAAGAVLYSKFFSESNINGRVTNTKYKVFVSLEDGTKLCAVSKNKFYEEGERVTVKYLPNKPKYCVIVDNNDF